MLQTSNLSALKALPSHEAMYPHGITSLAIPSKRMPQMIEHLGTTSIQEFQESKFVRPQSVFYELDGEQKRWYDFCQSKKRPSQHHLSVTGIFCSQPRADSVSYKSWQFLLYSSVELAAVCMHPHLLEPLSLQDTESRGRINIGTGGSVRSRGKVVRLFNRSLVINYRGCIPKPGDWFITESDVLWSCSSENRYLGNLQTVSSAITTRSTPKNAQSVTAHRGTATTHSQPQPW